MHRKITYNYDRQFHKLCRHFFIIASPKVIAHVVIIKFSKVKVKAHNVMPCHAMRVPSQQLEQRGGHLFIGRHVVFRTLQYIFAQRTTERWGTYCLSVAVTSCYES